MQSFFGSSVFGFSVTRALLFSLLFDAAVKVTMLMAFAGLCALALGRASASARHFVWRMAFAGVVVMFAGTFLLLLLAANSTRIVPPVASVPVWRTSDAMPRMAMQRMSARASAASLLPGSTHHVPTAPTEANAPAPSLSTTTLGHSQTLVGMGLLWLGGTLLVLLRMISRLRAVTVLERHSHALTDAHLLAIAHDAAVQTGLSALPRLLTQNAQPGLFSPLTWGWRGACVLLLPCDALTWPDARVDAVLRHELAHVRRNDWIAQRGAEAVCALLWFHPLVWLAARQLRASAEQACDDAALSSGVQAALYAQHLLDIARLLHRAPALPPAALPFLSRLPLESRLRAVLDPRARRKQLPPRMSRFLFGLTALCLLPTALIVPTVSRTLAQEISAPVRALNNKVGLPGGVTVELLGIARIPPGGRLKPSTTWWQMDGTPLSAPPYQSNNSLGPFYENKSAYAIGLRISGLAAKVESTVQDAHPVVTAFGIKPHTTTDEREWNMTKREHDRYTNLHTIRMEASAGVTQGTLRFGVATGEWKDAQFDKIETGTDCMLHRDRHNFPTWTWIPSTEKPRGTLRVALIKTTDGLGMVTRRIMASARSGKTTIFNGYWVDMPNNKVEFRVDVPDNIKWNDYSKFQLQTRPYQWAEFPNISFQPRQATQTAQPTATPSR